jgi:two-component system sensor histidine kinase PilS (NtrC family)
VAVAGLSGYLAEGLRRADEKLAQASNQLADLQAFSQHVIDSLMSGLATTDVQGTVLTFNHAAATITGVAAEEAIGMPVVDLLQLPKDFDGLFGVREGRPRLPRLEFAFRRRDGRPIELGISTASLITPRGETGFVFTFQDVTESRRMEREARVQQRLAAVGEMAAGIAHEIRNPLASISGSIEILYNELELSGDDKHLMELIMKESDRLNKIINDFLEFARLRPPRRRPVEMGKCVDEVAALLANNPAARNGIDIRVVHADGELTVESDEEQMKQVVVNLAINACEAMTRGGKLAIETRRTPDGQAKITVRDEGPGIGLEARARLFEPFFTTKEGGTGLGLAIANKIVESHGGTIETRNREEGGAEFSVVIPLRRARDKDRVAEPAGAVGSR